MILNFIILLVIIGIVIIGCIYYYNKSLSSSTINSFEKETVYDLKTMTQRVSEAFTTMLKQDLREINLTKEELEKKERVKTIIRSSLREAAYGNSTAKRTIKGYIKDIIQEPEFGIDASSINKIIHFDDVKLLSSQDKFEILVYIFSVKLGKGKKGFSSMVKEFGMAEPYVDSNGEERYDISSSKIDYVYDAVSSSSLAQAKLDYNDKLEILTQRIFQLYKGFGPVDILFDTDVDEIDCGVNGISKDTFSITENDARNLEYSFESIWVLLAGMNVRLSCLTFGKQEELIRVCHNIYKYNAPYVLSKKAGYVVSTMKDGSRIVVARPPFANSYMFFARKFDSTPSIEPEKLIIDQNKEIPITIMKWLIKGQRNIGITGSQGTGKTTFLKSVVRFIDATFNIRIQELASELNLNYAYPNRNIVSFQETEYITAQEGLNLQKKTNGTVNIIGEVATAIQAIHIIQTATVASLFAMFTHHAKTASDLVIAIRNNLLESGVYSNEKAAEEMAAKVLNIDCHWVNIKGHRYIERITEIIPIKDHDYPSDKVAATPLDKDTREYYKRITDRQLFEVRNIVEYKDGAYQLVNMPSDTMLAEMCSKLTDEEEEQFEKEMNYLIQLTNQVKEG